MPDDKNEGAKHASTHPISRRDFALGSVAILGASLTGKAAAPPLSEEARAMKLQMTESLRDLLDIRHITEDDIRRVIDHAEKTGEKLYKPDADTYLSRLRISEVYYYVEYSPSGDGYSINTAYSHRLSIGERN